MSAKEVMQMNYLFDSSKDRILGYRELIASPDVVDKSGSHINTLFSRYIQKYGSVVNYLLLANIYCDKTNTYYNSIFDSKEIQALDEIAEQGSIIEINYLAVYDKKKYDNKQDVIDAYEKNNFEGLLSETKDKKVHEEKETQKIKKVWIGQKDKVDAKMSSQGNSQESNFYKNNKTTSIASFFKKPA